MTHKHVHWFETTFTCDNCGKVEVARSDNAAARPLTFAPGWFPALGTSKLDDTVDACSRGCAHALNERFYDESDPPYAATATTSPQ